MKQSHGRTATLDLPVEPGSLVYDSEGCRVGVVDEVDTDRDTVNIRQAGLVLGWLGGEFVVPRPLVAGTCSDGITLNLTAAELEEHRLRRS